MKNICFSNSQNSQLTLKMTLIIVQGVKEAGVSHCRGESLKFKQSQLIKRNTSISKIRYIILRCSNKKLLTISNSPIMWDIV